MGQVTNQDAARIRKRLYAKEPVSSIAEDYNVSTVTIRNIGKGKTHKSAGGPISTFSKARVGSRNGKAKLLPDDVASIRKRASKGESQASLAREFRVSRSAISRLVRNKRQVSPEGIDQPNDEFLELKLDKWKPDRDSPEEAQLVERVFIYYRARGFPTRTFDTQRIPKAWEAIRRAKSVVDGCRVKLSNTGLKVVNSYHPQIDGIRCKGLRTAIDVFNDDALFKNSIKKHIRYGSHLTPQGIRYAVYNYGGVQWASNFRPIAVRSLVDLFGVTRMLDPCMGFGGRMYGCIAAGAEYVGVDPAPKMIRGNLQLITDIHAAGIETPPVTLVQNCAEDVLGRRSYGRFDLVLTSPPYFNLEEYDYGPGQSFVRYPQLGTWIKCFLEKMLKGAATDLNVYGWMLINVSIPLLPIVREIGVRLGLRPVMTFDYELYMRRFRQSKQGRSKAEPIILFQKMGACK